MAALVALLLSVEVLGAVRQTSVMALAQAQDVEGQIPEGKIPVRCGSSQT